MPGGTTVVNGAAGSAPGGGLLVAVGAKPSSTACIVTLPSGSPICAASSCHEVRDVQGSTVRAMESWVSEPRGTGLT